MRPYKFSADPYKALGEQIMFQTCSSALFVLCRSPIYRRTKKYWRSHDDLEFIQRNGLEKIANFFALDINGGYLKMKLFDFAKKVRKKYAKNSRL